MNPQKVLLLALEVFGIAQAGRRCGREQWGIPIAGSYTLARLPSAGVFSIGAA